MYLNGLYKPLQQVLLLIKKTSLLCNFPIMSTNNLLTKKQIYYAD